MAYDINGGDYMPRPRKCRKVCCMPKTTEFSPNAFCVSVSVLISTHE